MHADSDKQGLVQGMVTGIRGLCNGLGPAMYGVIFYLFHVDLNEKDVENIGKANATIHTMDVSLTSQLSSSNIRLIVDHQPGARPSLRVRSHAGHPGHPSSGFHTRLSDLLAPGHGRGQEEETAGGQEEERRQLR